MCNVCVGCAWGTDARLTLRWTLSRLWAGRVSGGAVENGGGGARLHPAARRAVFLSDGQSWFVSGSQLLGLETVSVGRRVPQARAAGGFSANRGAREVEHSHTEKMSVPVWPFC